MKNVLCRKEIVKKLYDKKDMAKTRALKMEIFLSLARKKAYIFIFRIKIIFLCRLSAERKM